MEKDKMITGSIDSIESLGLHDGPGIRVVVFLNGCKLRCKYCHNPEMWKMKDKNNTSDELVRKVLNFRDYIKNGGVTLSGGEPLLQPEFIIDVLKKLKDKGIHTAIDTAGVGIGQYKEILEYCDLIILDIKATDDKLYKDITKYDVNEFNNFIGYLNKSKKTVWLRHVIIPGVNDNIEYLHRFKKYIKKIDNVEKIEFLPYHTLAYEKYEKLGINNPYSIKKEVTQEECDRLYDVFINLE